MRSLKRRYWDNERDPPRLRPGNRMLPRCPGLKPLRPNCCLRDDENPTSLAFGDDSTRDALERTLELLRSGALTLSEKQLAQAPAIQWFLRGRLGMITGDRSWVPRLRRTQGLNFDVMPIPTLDTAATTGELTGFCLARRPESLSGAADLLVHLISDDVVRPLVRTGYLVPANQQVALSDDYYERVAAQLSEQEMADLAFVVAAINAWNRLNIGFRTVPGSRDKAYGLDKAGLS